MSNDSQITCTIERLIYGWRCSAMVGGHRFSKLYIGYTKKEAIEEFRKDISNV